MAKRRGRRGRPSHVRELSEAETAYLEELELYEKVAKTTALLSFNQHGIETDGRGMRAMRIFTRQTVVGLTLRKVLPRPSPRTHHERESWDICSLASLSRNLMEGFLSLHYFGLEAVSDEEAELRFLLGQLQRNIVWREIRIGYDPSDPRIAEFEAGISAQKDRIREHSFLDSLTVAQRSRVLAWHEMYKTKADFEAEVPACKGLRRDHRHLSNLVHPLPLSIERIDNERGRGVGSDPDVTYCILCLMLARRYLAASTAGIADRFWDELGSRFEAELSAIRLLVMAGFGDAPSRS